MSVSVVTSLRPLRGQCIRQARVGLLSLNIKSRSASFNLQAIVALQPPHCRFRSTIRDLRKESESSKSGAKDEKKDESKDGDRKAPLPKLTFRQFWGRALTVSLRNLAFAMSPSGVRQAYRDAPISTSIILFMQVDFNTYSINRYIGS